MCLYIILLLPLLLSDSAPPYFMDFSSSRQQSLNVHCFTNKITPTYYGDAVRFSSPGGVSDNPIPTARGQIMPTALVLAQPDLKT